ncbi:proto-oncogene tyrosine-protein kinase ROS-like [Camponotus floridanus]|uniref:proto-oncogene tyrosine-protein kinase ROS-like n=1 Tax=Camponotus floridanus TaxID=104421 RepID=UPI000DC6C37C|nr:proto-oncogene tyrosine-protein kinase ROS-like [Camponotus floridanus]
MAEEDVIFIDDEDEDVIIINIEDEDVIIVDEDIEEAVIVEDGNQMDVDGSEEESEEEEIPSLVDSDYASDNDEELRLKKFKHLNVFRGMVKNLERSGTEISVAIKTLQKDAFSHEKKKLIEEAKLMNHFRHKRILRLLAICLDGDSPLLFVLELMEAGDLLKYLRDCRLQESDSPAVRLQDLLAICEDIVRSYCYLEELRFVHRDLACRNCIVVFEKS